MNGLTKELQDRYFYEMISNNVKDLICLHADDGVFRFVSPSITEITGFLPDEIIDRSIYEFVHPQEREEVKVFFGKYLNADGGPFDNVVYRMMMKNGGYVWMETNLKKYQDAFYESYGYVSSSKIYSGNKQKAQDTQQGIEHEIRLNKLKSSFVNLVTHEFRTPLSIIKSVVDLAMMKMEVMSKNNELKQLTEDFGAIEGEVDNLTMLIDDVLLIEKIEFGETKFTMKPTDLMPVLKKAVERLSKRYPNERHISISMVGAPKPVWGEPKYLEMIFVNILSNALKYSFGKPAPEIRLSFFDYEAIVTIKDFGIGIPVAEQEKLFSTFFRAENVGNIEGTGLGLSIVKKFIELHGGFIEFNSVPSVGSEFSVHIPLIGL